MIRLIASLLLIPAGLGALAATSYAQSMVCWYEDSGQRSCADRLPPDQAHRDHEYLNEQGIVIRRVRGELTEEERVEQTRLERERQERERAETELQRYRQFLFESYASIESIENMRDRTLAEIDSDILIYIANLESLNDKLEGLHRNSQRYAPYSDRENAPPMPDILIRDIEATKSSITLFETRLEEERKNQEVTRQEFERDIEYFREMQQDRQRQANLNLSQDSG